MKYKSASLTLKGKRKENQDNVLFLEKDGILLASVADGMGGHVGGAKASEIVNETISALFERTNFPDHEHSTMVKWLDYVSNSAQKKLNDFTKENQDFSDMGSTLVCALIVEDIIHILNIGDSRAQAFWSGVVSQITKDQNLREHLISTQTINIKDYSKNAFSNVLMSSLGPTKTTEKDYYKVRFENEMSFLLTSDGIHDYIDSNKLSLFLSKKTSLKTKTQLIAKEALENNSNDNLSIILIKGKK